MRRIRQLRATGLVVFLLALGATPAQAEEIDGGTTRIKLSDRFVTLMKGHGIRITAIDGARFQNRTVLLPVEGGSVDVVSARGAIRHGGALRFVTKGRSLALRELSLDTERGSVEAKAQRPLPELRFGSVGRFSHSRVGFGQVIRMTNFNLSENGAWLLERTLHRPGLFKPGMRIGSAVTRVRPRWVPVSEGRWHFTLAPGTFSQLEAIGVKPVLFEASPSKSLPVTYDAPLIGGRIYPGVSGSSALVEAGLRLERENPWTHLAWTNLGVDLETGRSGSSPVLYTSSGTSFPSAGPLAFLGVRSATTVINPKARTLSIAGLPVRLETEATNLINGTFASHERPVIYPGDLLGTVTVTMRGR